MRFQEMPITPELDEMQRAGLVWYRCHHWDVEAWDHDAGGSTPTEWEKILPGKYKYAVRLEE